jgi:glyoxylase-like metal-dependent hydrolase (beta-lactamase superfamily II)
MSAQQPNPLLANLVNQGEVQTEAVAITDYIFMARDLSNAYLVTTADGDLLVNTGFNVSAGRTKALLTPHRRGPLRWIIVTQSHADHYGGVPTLREPGTKIITQDEFLATRQYYQSLEPYFAPRRNKLWGSTIRLGANYQQPEEITPDVTFDKHYAFELGGRRFELLHTPDGETIDGLTVWMPNERVAFTGNLLGPVFMSMPFLCTLRGDRPRSVVKYLRSLDALRKLGAELLITGHGEPIRGAARIRADLDKLHAAVSWVRDYTLAGMNAGKDVHTLMREFSFPAELKIGEFHGKASWAVRTIWEEHAGWFHYDATTSLYGVPRSSVDRDLVELAGGAGKLAARARARLAAGQPLEAMHLVDIALGAESSNRDALTVKRDALKALLAASGGTNLSETMWLRSEIALTEAALG